MIKDIIKVLIWAVIIYAVLKLLIVLLGAIFYILAIVLLVIIILLFLTCIGENGYPHKCKHADRCPASVRCSNEEEMDCFESKED